MAYKNLTYKFCTDRAAALTEFWTILVAMGWTLHDNQDGSSYRVYKSDGENSDQLYGYIQIEWVSANEIRCTAWHYWNNTTHVGVAQASVSYEAYITTSETGLYFWVWGNKNVVVFMSKVSTTYYCGAFGHLPKKYWTVETSLTAGATAGSDVTITVSSTTNFKAGDYYQIVSNTGQGRDRVQVSSITDATHMVIASLPRDYSSGSRIGQTPCTFGHLNVLANWGLTCPYDVVGTANGTDYATRNVPMNRAAVDPDMRGGFYLLQPILFGEGASADDFYGYIDEYIFDAPHSGMVVEDMFGIGEQDSGTAESGTDNTLTDTDKSWSTNQWANKVVIITGGTGIGQIRKISSNTATVLTISENWTTNPDSSSQYVICDEGYRFIYPASLTVNAIACREGV